MKKKKSLTLLYAVCINNEDYKASLEIGKLYQLITDEAAEGDGMIRVIDESGEDYLFEAVRFYRVELPPALAKELQRVY